MVRLNIDDIDFSERECVVYGKVDKERKAYFDAKTKIHLINYIESRTDNNSALFVSLNKPHSRLTDYAEENTMPKFFLMTLNIRLFNYSSA